MIYLILLVFVVGIFEIRAMSKRKQSKEMIVFCVISFLTLLLGYIYLSNPYQESLAKYILSALGKEF